MAIVENLNFFCFVLGKVCGLELAPEDFRLVAKTAAHDGPKSAAEGKLAAVLDSFGVAGDLLSGRELIMALAYLTFRHSMVYQKLILEKEFLDFTEKLESESRCSISSARLAAGPLNILSQSVSTRNALKNCQRFKIDRVVASDREESFLRARSRALESVFKGSKFYLALAFSLYHRRETDFTKVLIERYKTLNAYLQFLKGCSHFTGFVGQILAAESGRRKISLTVRKEESSEIDVSAAEKLLSEFKKRHLEKEFVFL